MVCLSCVSMFFVFKQKTAYELRISDWSSACALPISGCDAAAQAAAKIAGVTKVLKADDAAYAHGLAENLAPLVAKLATGYSHVISAATTFGKNVMPRAAALLDVQQVSDVASTDGEDTFVRPIYAGNALAPVKSGDKVTVLTIRATAFDAAAAEGGDRKSTRLNSSH